MTSSGQKVIITSALLYANGVLHFGHLAGAYLAADCYARFQRLIGHEVLFVSGSDEYGVAVTLSAELEGRLPQAQVDHYHTINRKLFSQLAFSFDFYARTTWPRHHELVDQYFLDLLENDYIEARDTNQLYCPSEGRFLADRYVTGTCPRCRYEQARGDECPRCGASFESTDLLLPKSRLSGAPLEQRTTRHWFLCLDRLAPALKEWTDTRDWKSNVTHFLQHYLDNPLPRAITRDGQWGVPVPLKEAKGKVFYVWFEALIGYISASKQWAESHGKPQGWTEYWCDPNTRLVHFVGKDNIFFHGLFFPAMTLGQNQPFKLVDDLPANEFLNLEGKQFSKSEGWTVDLPDFLTRYTADQVRYALAANAPETSDAEFTFKDFQMRCNTELLGKYGNLANRTLVFTQRYCDACVPSCELQANDQEFLDHISALVGQIYDSYASYRLRQACHLIMELATFGNVYFNAKEPWKLAKDPNQTVAMHTTIRCCLQCLKALAIVSFPIIPPTASQLYQLLGITTPLREAQWTEALEDHFETGHPLPKPQVLFERVTDEQIEAEVARLRNT